MLLGWRTFGSKPMFVCGIYVAHISLIFFLYILYVIFAFVTIREHIDSWQHPCCLSNVFSSPAFLPQDNNSLPAPFEGGWDPVTGSSQRFVSISEACHFWGGNWIVSVRPTGSFYSGMVTNSIQSVWDSVNLGLWVMKLQVLLTYDGHIEWEKYNYVLYEQPRFWD